MVIPEDVYQENSQIIDEYLKTLAMKNDELTISEKKNPKMYRQKIKAKLENFMMSLPEWLFRKCLKQNQVRLQQVGRFEHVFFVAGKYDANIGFEVLEGTEEDNFG